MAPEQPPAAARTRPAGASGEQAPAAEGLASKLICRVRPCNNPSQAYRVLEREARIQVVPNSSSPGEHVHFDHVLASGDPREQEEAFELVRPGVLGCFRGGSCTVVAHGGPGSGKTYLLSGLFNNKEMQGLVPRAIRLIEDVLQSRRCSNVVAVESSFFEIVNDEAYDLIKVGNQRVGLQELAEPPFLALDRNLACQRSEDGGRLLDAYFTGLERRRRSSQSHSCFQIAFVHGDGRPRSYLRFVKVGWARPPAGAVPARGSPAQAPGRSLQALEEVLRCKLSSGASADLLASAYRASPLALLLKPGLEGAGVLYFWHCLRMEQAHLYCLVLAIPLVANLHLWLKMLRNAQAGAAAAAAPAAKRRPAPAVPRLQLGGGEGLEPLAPGDAPQQPLPALDDVGSSVSVSSTSSLGDSPRLSPEGAAGGAAGELTDGGPDGGAGASLVSSLAAPAGPAPAQLEPGAPGEASAGEARLDSWLLDQCGELRQRAKHSLHALNAEIDRASAFLRGLYSILEQLAAQRHPQDAGPGEKETNLKILYEKVYRSLQRKQEEAQRTQEDAEVLNQFCGGALLQTHEACEAKPAPAKSSGASLEARPYTAAFAVAPGKAGRPKGGLMVPQLPLDQLPQEHPHYQTSHWQSTVPVSTVQHQAAMAHSQERHGQPLPAPAPALWARPLEEVREVAEAEADAAAPQPAAAHYAPVAFRGCSLVTQAAGVLGGSVVACSGLAEAADLEVQRMQKSHSTASLRSLGPRCVVTTAVVPPVAVGGHSSPLPGNRAELAGGSPLRGGLLVGASGAAAAGGRGAASPPPPLPPRRPAGLASAPSAVPRAGVALQRPAPACKPRAATPGARPGPPQSFSPVALGRTVSAQSLRSVSAPGRSASPDPGRLHLAAQAVQGAVRAPSAAPASTPSLAFRACAGAPASAVDLQATASFSVMA